MNKVHRQKMKYSIKESTLVTKSVLESLMGYYDDNYSKDIKKKMVELLRIIDREIEKRHILPDKDIVDIKLYQEYTYEKENRTRYKSVNLLVKQTLLFCFFDMNKI